MKYFTPELLEHYGSENDIVADQGQAAWEKASEEYLRHYKSIEGSLPAKLRSVLDRFYLHDARLFGVALEPPFLFLTMQLDAPPHEVLVFQYYLRKEPEAIRWNQGSDPCPYAEWLYDEVDLKKVENIIFFEHSVLFTNGVELRIPFLQFDCLVQSPPSLQTWFTGHSAFPVGTGRPQFILSDRAALTIHGNLPKLKTPSGE